MIINLTVEHSAWDALTAIEPVTRAAAAAALPHNETRSVDVLFTSDDEMRAINRQWRGQDKPTNVLSFPAAPMPLPAGETAPLGDVVLAYETVAREAAEQEKSLHAHTSHLIVHGILHLLGYDHESEVDAEIMEDKERAILAALGIADPYAT